MPAAQLAQAMTDRISADARRSQGEPTWRQADDVLCRVTRDTVVLLRVAGAPDDDPLTLSGSAAAVWALLEVPATLASLSAELGDLYHADPDQVASDIQPLLDHLSAAGVLERSQ